MVFRTHDIQFAIIVAVLGIAVGFSFAWFLWFLFFLSILGLAIRLGRPVLILVGCLAILRGYLAVPTFFGQDGQLLSGIVIDDPVVSRASFRFTLRSEIGTIDVFSRPSEIIFGDHINVTCTSLARTSRFKNLRCQAEKIRIIARSSAPRYLEVLHFLKSWLTGAINRMLPSPEAPLLSGILLGSKSELPEKISSAFRSTGTTHIVAVSGFNVTIVLALILGIFRRLPLPRPVVTVMGMTSIIGFVLLTGASASVVRAGIMAGLVVLADVSGRINNALHSLLLSAGLMIVVHPAIFIDVGFQLSVAATAGLVLLSKPLSEWMGWVPNRFGLRESISTTLSAIFMTEPIIALTFGRISLVALPVNVLVLPLIPIAMATGFAAALLTGVFPGLGLLVGWIAWAPLAIVEHIVNSAAALPFATAEMGTIPSIIFSAVGTLIVVMLVGRGRRAT